MITPNTHFPEYKEYIKGKNLTESQLLDILTDVPNLLKKPILTNGNTILMGTSDPKLISKFLDHTEN